jgi:hypothetical protein
MSLNCNLALSVLQLMSFYERNNLMRIGALFMTVGFSERTCQVQRSYLRIAISMGWCCRVSVSEEPGRSERKN